MRASPLLRCRASRHVALHQTITRSMSTLPGKFDVISSSRIPTMHFQNSLPKLPVPTLEDSLQRMLYAAEPLATAAELEEMRTLADEFASGHGKPLQEALVAKDKAIYSSFITEPWFDMYLKDRRPLLLNQNPQLTFKDEEGTRGGPGTQLARAARLVHGAATFQRTLETNQLIPDIFHTQPHRTKTRLWEETVRLLPSGIAFYGAAALGAYPLDMSQYANLFKSTRVPGVEKDELVVAPKAKHVCVMRNGHFYKVDVLDQTARPCRCRRSTALSRPSSKTPTPRPRPRMRPSVYSPHCRAISGLACERASRVGALKTRRAWR